MLKEKLENKMDEIKLCTLQIINCLTLFIIYFGFVYL